MPGKNGSGPLGNGPLTGRGMGNCNRPATGQSTGQGMGRKQGCGQGRGLGLGRGQGRGQGMGTGQGRGMGRGQGFAAGQNQDDSKPNLTNTVVDEKAQLLQQADNLQAELESIKNRLSELEQ